MSELYVNQQDGMMVLRQDDMDRHGGGCACGLCNGNGKSYGVAIIPVGNPDNKQVVYGPSEDAAMHNAKLTCTTEFDAHPVHYDPETGRVTGTVPIALSDIIKNDLEGFLDIISDYLAGGVLGDITYSLCGHDKAKQQVSVTAEGSIAEYIEQKDPDNEFGLRP